MFSFRTTPIEEQLDKSLTQGRVGVFCTQNCWNPDTGEFLYDLFKRRGNLSYIFSPRDTELTPLTNHIEIEADRLKELDAVVVEIQDVGARYFNYTKDVLKLMSTLRDMGEEAPSMYVVDHLNPAGRVIEGTMPQGETSEAFVPKVAHRHGLTLGELCGLYYNEIGARFALHVISALSISNGKSIMPWTIAPCSDIPGLFTCDMYTGGGLWNNTNVVPGIGTARPYEYIGAPFIKPDAASLMPTIDGAMLRPCSFTPATGRYENRKCYGFQILLEPGTEYHSLIHTLQLMRQMNNLYPAEFKLEDGFKAKLSDPVLYDYIFCKVDWEDAKEHIKVEEQKWIRKAKKFLLYDDQPYRIK